MSSCRNELLTQYLSRRVRLREHLPPFASLAASPSAENYAKPSPGSLTPTAAVLGVRDNLRGALPACWENSLRTRAAIAPHSAGALIEEMLAQFRPQPQAPS